MTCNGFGEIVSDGSLIGGILLGTAVLVLAVPPLLHFFYRGVVREIVIVKKRETVRNFFSRGGYGSFDRYKPPVKSSYVEMQYTSVDYRIKGKKLLHTKFCDREIIKKLTVGQTYTVRIRLNYIIKIFPKK